MSLTLHQWIALSPILLTSASALVLMAAIAIRRHHWWNATIGVSGLNVALLSCVGVALVIPQTVTPLLAIDGFADFYMALILATTLATGTLTHAYMEGFTGNKEEIYLLLILSCLGALLLVCARNFVPFFIGLELMSVPLYAMIAYPYFQRRSLEAGIKYLILSAAATAFILFGLALIYARAGTMDFDALAYRFGFAGTLHDLVLLAGGGLVLIGVGFKISAVPFHQWTPDVYEGAPAPVTGFLATAAKAAIIALMLRYFVSAQAYHSETLLNILSVLALLSIVVGNVLALMQDNIKRLIAYSSIAHFGYVLVAFVAAGALAIEAVGIYLLTYIVTTLAALGIVSLVSSPLKDKDADELWDYRGLFWRRPYLAAILTWALLSLAGIPMTAGFIGKFYVVAAGVNARLWILIGATVFGSAVGLFYYLRAMIQLYLRAPWVRKYSAPRNWAQQVGGIMMLGITLLMVVLGFYPEPFIRLIQLATIQGH